MGINTDLLKALCVAKNLNYVPHKGNNKAPICFVGEAPGEQEDRELVPFVGASGKLADKMLLESGLSLSDIWFTNPYKVRPPNNKLGDLEQYAIPFSVYQDQFFEELQETKPVFIIAAGVTPLSILCPFTRGKKSGEFGIQKWRGSLLTSPRLNWEHYIIPIYHPAFILRDWSEFDVNVFILKKVLDEFNYYKQHKVINPLPTRELIVEPTSERACDYLTECINGKDPISIDIELIRRRVPYVVSFAKSPYSAISVSLWDYSPSVNAKLWRLFDRIFSTKRQIGQNYTSFDAHWLYHLGFNVNSALVDDTRVRHNILWPELSHKLEFMVMQYTREPYYKDEGRGWTLKDGKSQLMKYNCKDTTCTYEVYLEQEKEFNENPKLKEFYQRHERLLAANMFNIERRGVATDPVKLQDLRGFIKTELADRCTTLGQITGKTVVANARDGKKAGQTAFNVGSSKQVIGLLKSRGLKVPKSKVSGNETAGEDALNALFAETNDPALKIILDFRELNKILTTNVNCKLIDNIYYSVYIVGGTVGGRRASKANPLGFGGNGQNIPKHSKLGKKVRGCFIARPGKILLQCDQVGAEDWIINGIIGDQTGDLKAIKELQAGVDRHQKLAAFIFGVSDDQCSRDAQTNYRYVGKRTRYAGSYGMGASKFASVLAKEGLALSIDHCGFLLNKFHEYDPGIKQVFQTFVERSLVETRKLTDLFGRERQFFGLHPYRDNSKIFREAYSYIPQSTIGDNNGAAINYVEYNSKELAIMEVHDSLVLEVGDNITSITNAVKLLQDAYHRTLRFPKGLELEVPIEIELGYNMQDMSRCENLTETGLISTYNTLVLQASHLNPTTSGAQHAA